jgi:type II secretory pathway pseudopilin PulG
MAVLLVGLSVMGVMASAAMPVWKHMTQREKEEEYIFRGRQYARAIELFQRKMPGALPPNLDILIDQKFLRKKYKDPITNDDFVLLSPSQAALGTTTPGASTGTTPTSAMPGRGDTAGRGQPQAPQASGRGQPAGGRGRGTPVLSGRGSSTPGGVQEGIIGVTSKSKEKSIRTFNGRTRYNEWIIQFVARTQAPGAGAGGTPTPGATGAPGPGGRGSATPGGSGRGGRGSPAGPGGRGSPGRGPAGRPSPFGSPASGSGPPVR